MLKSELLEKLKDIAEDADINEAILGMDDFAKSSEIDVTKITLDDYKNMLANNEIVKAYFTSQLDSGISKAVNSHDQKFMKDKFPKLLEEEVQKRLNADLTPEQKQIKEMQAQLDAMKAEKERAELLNANSKKLKEQGLNTDLAKYIKTDDDIDFFKNLINDSVQEKVKNKLGHSSYKPPVNNDSLNTITKEQFNKMGYKERLNLYNTNKELYEKLQNEQ